MEPFAVAGFTVNRGMLRLNVSQIAVDLLKYQGQGKGDNWAFLGEGSFAIDVFQGNGGNRADLDTCEAFFTGKV